MIIGKCCNSICGMVVLLNLSSLAFFVYRVTCMQISGSSILESITMLMGLTAGVTGQQRMKSQLIMYDLVISPSADRKSC
jgi:hypothetical protein